MTAYGYTKKIKITREYALPGLVRLELLKTVPALGSKILFFSGGTTLYLPTSSTVNTVNTVAVLIDAKAVKIEPTPKKQDLTN